MRAVAAAVVGIRKAVLLSITIGYFLIKRNSEFLTLKILICWT